MHATKDHLAPAVIVLPLATTLLVVPLLAACGGEDADEIGVGAECSGDADCRALSDGLNCLSAFRGGYCGLAGCAGDDDCPDRSVCVRHEDGYTYCFRTCRDKPECNANRAEDVEANCTSSAELLEATGVKVCVPPSSGP